MLYTCFLTFFNRMVNVFLNIAGFLPESTYSLENAINRDDAIEKYYLLFVRFNIMLTLKNIIANITVEG